jgi:hypothetical protein
MASFARGPGRSKLAPLAAGLACVALAVFWCVSIVPGNAWGWDETMHVGAPAWRLLIAARELQLGKAFEALHDCERYPFAFPVVVAAFQGLFGASMASAQILSTLVWCATIWGVFLLAREVRDDGWTPWLALAFAATCPLALSFAGTLMLEVPATGACVFALRAWVRRNVPNPSDARGRDLAASAWLAAAFFTKFNYGLLLWAALAVDHVFALWAARARGELRFHARRTLTVALVPAVALAWWFLLPLPFGLERAAEHRAAFFDWITGNQDAPASDWKRRVLSLATSFAFDPRALLVLLVGVVASLHRVVQPAVRTLAIALAVFAVAIFAHPFHLPRFLIPIGAAAWPLAAVGWSSLLPSARGLRAASLALIVAVVAIAPGVDTPRLADALGFLSGEPKVREYQAQVLASYRELGPERHVQHAGLPVGELGEFLDVVARAIRHKERVAWLDLTDDVSPAGLQFGLWRRGGSPERALQQLGEKAYVSIDGFDPHWSDAELTEFAKRFDVLLFTEPHSLKGKRDREFFADYVARLEALGWRRQRAGQVAFSRPMAAPLEVAVFTLRREVGR